MAPTTPPPPQRVHMILETGHTEILDPPLMHKLRTKRVH